MVWAGCRPRPDADKLFADAESLRARYEKDASQQAIAKYRTAVAAWQKSGETGRAARAAQRLGMTYWQLGALPESREAYETALLFAQRAADPVLESEIRSDVGIAQAFSADRGEILEAAEKQCQLALRLARQAGHRAMTAKSLECLGEAAYFRQKLEPALEFFRQAGDLWAAVADQRGQAQNQVLQGYVHSDLSRFDQARTCYERAQSYWSSIGDRREQAITLVADARLLLRRGKYQEALNEFGDALTRLEPMGDAVWEGASLTGIAQVQLDMAQTSSALASWERALQIFENARLKSIAVDVLMSLGSAYLASGDDAHALTRFERALALAGELRIERWKAFALRFIGVVYLFRNSPAEARQYLDRSLDVQRTLEGSGGRRLEARTLADLGKAHQMLGAHEVAIRYFNEAVVLSRSALDRVTEARGLFGLARISAGLNDLERARTQIEDALRVAESLRTDVENRDLRVSYSASVYQWHELHVDILMRLRQSHRAGPFGVRAFEATEQARARSLLESLTEAEVDLRTGIDHDLLERELLVNKAFDEWANRNSQFIASGGKTQTAGLAEEYRELEYRYNQVEAEIRSKSPRYAALVRPKALSLRDVQRELVDSDTLLLEYALGDERSYLWAISNRDYVSYVLPSRAQIEQSARRVYELLTARIAATPTPEAGRRLVEDADRQYWQEASRLSNMLLGPIAKQMSGKRLLLVTDGALQYLPFAALPIPGARDPTVPMLVQHEIINLPSASVLAVLRRDSGIKSEPRKAVAVLADPIFGHDDPRLPASNSDSRAAGPANSASADSENLRGSANQSNRGSGSTQDTTQRFPRLIATGAEADDIIAAAPEGMSLKALGFDASRATAMSGNLANYHIVHFATHSVLNNEDPGLSGVMLSMFDKQGRPQDGFLRLHDIYSLKLPADLVVLSACNTALGKPVRGEGLVGMLRGFMYAGAKRVLASYWKVDDEATAELMRRFYLELLKQHHSPAAALRQAQLAMLHVDRWHSPFYWAAFVLEGEWK